VVVVAAAAPATTIAVTSVDTKRHLAVKTRANPTEVVAEITAPVKIATDKCLACHGLRLSTALALSTFYLFHSVFHNGHSNLTASFDSTPVFQKDESWIAMLERTCFLNSASGQTE
jgi:hypothetical protein